MKRILTIGLMLLSVSSLSSAQAQEKRQYDDDIYGISRSSDQREETTDSRANTTTYSDRDNTTYSSSGSSSDSRSTSNQYSDEYYESDDDYYYATRISRFNYPFYNRPYWSSFYNPYWYDPYWVDPYWGWSPWTRPGLTLSFGYGPYWSSYWGWNSWYGYPGFGAYYGNPYGGWGWGGGYYSGYWNGYYAGMYNGIGDGGYGRNMRTITYGPRYNLRPRTVGGLDNSINRGGVGSFRQAPATGNNNTFNTSAPAVRNERMRSLSNEPTTRDRDVRQQQMDVRNDEVIREPRGSEVNSNRGTWSNGNSVRGAETNTPSEAPRRERGGFFGGGQPTEQRQMRAPSEAPRVEQQRTYSQPRFEPAPSRSFERGGGGGGFGGSRGGGGFGGGSGGGGSFGGGRRR